MKSTYCKKTIAARAATRIKRELAYALLKSSDGETVYAPANQFSVRAIPVLTKRRKTTPLRNKALAYKIN